MSKPEIFINKNGFYTVGAAIFLPLFILAVLTIGYFVRADSIWENAMHGALDECSYSAASCSSGTFGEAARKRVVQRVNRDNPELSVLDVSGTRHSCHIQGTVSIALPLGFGRDYHMKGHIRYRDFTGSRYKSHGMGSEALETPEVSDPVWIFPQSGIRYHSENCSYVKASVHSCILSGSLKRKYSSCSLCHSGNLSSGSMVFCFNGADTSYHRGSCPSIKKHTAVIDKNEAIKKGYTPCSKCGGN